MNDSGNKENQDSTLLKPSTRTLLKPKSQRRDTMIADMLCLQKSKLEFGHVLPGTILEEDVLLMLKSNEGVYIQSHVICDNEEFADLDEYVLSVRKATNYEYLEKVVVTLTKQSTMVKVAIKVPNVRHAKHITGSVRISVASLSGTAVSGTFVLPISAKVVVPYLTCLKQLRDGTTSFIRLAVKAGRVNDCKVPLRNNSSFPLTLEPEMLLSTPDLTITLPATINAATGASFLVVFQVKAKQPSTEIKQILILKVKNSSIHFSFPLRITLC